MSAEKRARLQQWLASGEARLQPISLPQRELWEATPVPVTDPANHICCLIFLRGQLTPEHGRRALERVVERQEVLRLSILPGKEGPLQLIRKEAEPALHFAELPGAGDTVLAEHAERVFREPFDLVQGPLYRATIFRRGPDDHVLAFALHHAIGDGWTLGAFVQDLAFAYAQILLGMDREPLPPVPLSYSAWSQAERAYWHDGELKNRAEFWRTTLAGSRRVWPGAEPEKAAWALDRWVSAVPPELGGALRALARREGVTLFSTLLAAFQIALARWSGVHDLVVGTPVANRHQANVRETMGYFAGVVPLRGQIEANRSFAEAIRAVHQVTIDCFAHALPFAELLGLLDPPRSPFRTSAFRRSLCLAKSSRARRDALLAHRPSADALDRHRTISPGVRSHGRG